MFEDRTTEKLKEETLAEIDPAVGVSTMAGSYADATVGPLCRQVSRVYQSLPAVLSMLFVDESSGPFLDLVGRDYHNLQRRAGTKARCAVTLTGKAGTQVGAGTVFLTATGLAFRLRAAVSIGAGGSAVGELEAAEAGSAYNIAPGSLAKMYVNLPGLEGYGLRAAVSIGAGGSAVGELEAAEAGSAYNIAPGSLAKMYVNLPGLEGYVNTQGEGGTDTESDAALYGRIDEARKRPRTSGNGWDYRGWALEVAGVGEAKVVELAAGPGTVGVTVVDSNFEGASPKIVEDVKAAIQAKRPVGASVTVTAAGELEISVVAVVSLSGTSTGGVKAELEKRLRAYLQELIQQKCRSIYYDPASDVPYTLYYNRVLALLLTIDGVQTFTTLTVNDGTADLSIPASSVPVLGEVHVS